jgi:hypothetical protein
MSNEMKYKILDNAVSSFYTLGNSAIDAWENVQLERIHVDKSISFQISITVIIMIFTLCFTAYKGTR